MIEAKRIPVIPTEYRGIKFRSKLEAKYAKAFDRLGMPWVYEEVNYEFDDSTRYAPDFYFPECDQFFEVKGLMLADDQHKIDQLVRIGKTVTVGDGQGQIQQSRIADDGYVERADLVYINDCKNCGVRSFISPALVFECPHCGSDDIYHGMIVFSGPGVDYVDIGHTYINFFDAVFSE